MEFIFSNIILFAIILVFSIWQSVQDIKKMRIDLWLQFLAIGVAAVVQGVISGQNVWINLLSAAIFGAVYFGVYLISKGKFGLGDVYFGIFQGLFLPVKMLPVCLALEVLAAFIIEYLICKNKEKFPFIPYMGIGLILSWIIVFFLNSI